MAKIYNIGIIGFGSRARGIWEKSILPYSETEGNDKCRLVAIVDVRPEEELRAELEVCGATDARIYRDPVEMYENEKLDGTIIGTRCSLHTKMALINARYGIPVLLEKPVSTTDEDLAALEGILDTMDEKTLISFPLRVAPLAVRAKEIIDTGILGKISQVQAINNVPYARGYYHGWYRDENETGGLFLQKSTHDLDLIQFILGEPKPFMISATESKLIFKGDMPAGLKCKDCERRKSCPESDINVATYGDRYAVRDNCCFAVDTGNHDSASIIVQYEGGLHAVYSQNFVARKAAGRRGLRIIGYNATLEFEFNSKCIDIFYHNENKTEHIDMTDLCQHSHGGGDRRMIDAYVKMLGGERSPAPLSYGILSAKLCLAAKKSARDNVFVRID
ncbi:MAG: Gfo/Idh/MocA family oxidoreductase [Clostridia bacterium]|nr:Gfo/Idh/MocA family oxidoreductase [Clostridia bacterium]MBR6726276.1 Gfo/Idh/MocA family oxidoreductase [Clostridia bacterium]